MDAHQFANSKTVYLIRPRLGGLANDTTIEVEHGPLLYHVRSKPLAVLGREYVVQDDALTEVLRTEQDHTIIFPQHTLLQNAHPVGKIGQEGLIPQMYFVQLPDLPRAVIHVGGADPIFPLRAEDGFTLAEVAQSLSTWIVIIPSAKEHLLVLASLAIIYRENTIGG